MILIGDKVCERRIYLCNASDIILMKRWNIWSHILVDERSLMMIINSDENGGLN
ncbi:hypothetical protein J2S08_000053 [Bacillus chungangensis]|uniref:Uncharacterized protein n=1 Tax=Bacillus chungangensis TaxID=587633 RepID=A0ABT9WLX6_9BACI|nr:hypothetical protein [Bacillus chungangensis]